MSCSCRFDTAVVFVDLTCDEIASLCFYSGDFEFEPRRDNDHA